MHKISTHPASRLLKYITAADVYRDNAGLEVPVGKNRQVPYYLIENY